MNWTKILEVIETKNIGWVQIDKVKVIDFYQTCQCFDSQCWCCFQEFLPYFKYTIKNQLWTPKKFFDEKDIKKMVDREKQLIKNKNDTEIINFLNGIWIRNLEALKLLFKI